MRVRRVSLLHVFLLPACAALLPGCYAGIAAIVAVVAGQSSSGGSDSFWEVTELQVASKAPLDGVASPCQDHPSPPDGASCSDLSRALLEIAGEAGLDEYVSGTEVRLVFRVERRGAPGGTSSTPLVLDVAAEGSSSITIELGRYKEGSHELSWDSTPYGRGSPQNVLLSLGPGSNKEDQTLARAVVVDNRPPAPPARLCKLKGMECDAGIQDVVELLCSIDAPSDLLAGSWDPTCYIDASGKLRSLPLQFSVHSPELCAPTASLEFVAAWDTRIDAPDISGEALGLVLIKDLSGAHRPRASLLTCPSSCFRVNNSRPRIANLSVSSEPKGAGKHERELVGRVVFRYDVVDTGTEAVRLHIAAEFPELSGSVVKLSTDDGSLSEALGDPSEGTDGLATSSVGATHHFVWNSDHDIDALLREGRLSTPFVPEVTFKLSVTNEGSCRSSDTVIRTLVLNNRLVHSVAGVLGGQTPPGELTVARDQVLFETLSAADASADASQLFLLDSGSNCAWRMDFRDDATELRRIAGDGTRRFDREPGDFEGDAAILVPLDTPVDIAVIRREERNAFLILENTGVLWEVDSGVAGVLFDGRGLLHRPAALAVETVGGEEIIYIADTGNCRVIRFVESTGVAEVILGALKTLRPGDDPLVQGGEPFPATNGCNFLEDPTMPVHEPARDVLDESFGLTVHTSPSRRTLLVSDTLGNRLLRLDLGPAGDPNAAPSAEAVVLVSQESEPLFCGPSALRFRGAELFIASRQLNFGGNASKGAVFLARIRETPAGIELQPGGLERIAGGLRGLDGVSREPSCAGSLNEASTYVPSHECLPALDAPLAKPTDLLLDANRSLYICDSRNQRLRKLGEGGGTCLQPNPQAIQALTNDDRRLVTFVGGSVEGRGAPDARVTDPCRIPSAAAEKTVPATACKLSEPIGAALVDDRLLLACDRGNHRVLAMDLKTGLVATVAGRTQAEEERAAGLFFGGDGGLAVEALLSSPNSVAVSPAAGFCEAVDRQIFIADALNHRIRRVDANGMITTVAGSGSSRNDTDLEPGPLVATAVDIPQPRGVLVDSAGRVLIADNVHRILRLDDDGMLHWIAGLPAGDPRRDTPCPPGDGGAECLALAAILMQPSQLALDADERFLFVADQGNRRVRRIEYDRTRGTCGTVRSIAGTGNRNIDGRFPTKDALALGFDISSPHGIALSGDGRTLFFTEVFAPCRIYRVDLEDRLENSRLTLIAGQEVQGSAGDGEENEQAQLFNPNAIQLDSSGQVLYVVDGRNHRVRRFWVGEDPGRP